MKYAGIPVGDACVFCDLFKGFLPSFLALRYTDPRSLWFASGSGLPHPGSRLRPLYHGRGGKAIAVTFGALLGLVPHEPAGFRAGRFLHFLFCGLGHPSQ